MPILDRISLDNAWLPKLNPVADNPNRILPKFGWHCRQIGLLAHTHSQEAHRHTVLALPLCGAPPSSRKG
jgi:hypothetical protein